MDSETGRALLPLPILPVLAVGAFAVGTDTFVVAGVLPSVAASLEISIATAGWISSLFALVYAVMAPVLGALTGRMDRRKVMLISLLGFGVGNIASACAPTIGTLLAARALTALCAALYIPTASAVAAALTPPERRARAMSVVLGGISVATVAGVPFGTWLAADLDWRATFAVVAGIGLLCAALLALCLPALSLPAAPGLAARLAPARDPRVFAAVATTFLILTGGYTALTYVGAVFGESTDGNGTTLAFLLLIFGVAGVCGTVLAGRGTDRFGAAPVLLLAIAGLFVVLATLSITRAHLGLAAAALALWGLAGMASQPPQQHRLFGIAPQAGPLLLSLNSAATFAGIALGGAIGNRVLEQVDTDSLDTLGWAGAAIVALSVIPAVLAGRRPATVGVSTGPGAKTPVNP
ncbi:MFS transporter [Nocardia sp. NPDC127579]|uniref:MFS transporter n=1 Tax=Nocardia sp. NPDC127579 TaxID=3345402 RepID=UPI00363DDF8C